MSELVIKTSRHSVSLTVSHLLAVVATRGMKEVAYLAPSTYVERYGLTDELTSRLAGIDAVVDAALAEAMSPAMAGGPAEGVVDQPQEESE